jgi:hypothetical protein
MRGIEFVQAAKLKQRRTLAMPLRPTYWNIQEMAGVSGFGNTGELCEELCCYAEAKQRLRGASVKAAMPFGL